MLLSVHMTSVLFLVWFNNFALTMGLYWSYTLLLKLLMFPLHSSSLKRQPPTKPTRSPGSLERNTAPDFETQPPSVSYVI